MDSDGPVRPVAPIKPLTGVEVPATTPKSMYEALSEFQRHLPPIVKSADGQSGNHVYKYAPLEDVTEVVLPKLTELGFVWTCLPMMTPPGSNCEFGLLYRLAYPATNESIEGVYPIPIGRPQDMGSAITYARRYALCAVTGVTPRGDDNDASPRHEPAQPEAPRQQVSRATVPEFKDRLRDAANEAELQKAWMEIAAAGLGRDGELVAIKDTRKKELGIK